MGDISLPHRPLQGLMGTLTWRILVSWRDVFPKQMHLASPLHSGGLSPRCIGRCGTTYWLRTRIRFFVGISVRGYVLVFDWGSTAATY